jgi:hypothetical protein
LTKPVITLLLLAGAALRTAAAPAIPEPTESHAASLLVFRLERDFVSGPEVEKHPWPVGSLAKPFVAKAWAQSHPGEATPRFTCTGGSSCWLPAGHGALGLAKAVAVSCNAYFRALAEATPENAIVATLREEEFLVPIPLSAEAAMGGDGSLAIRPGALLRAYARLTRRPWVGGEPVRAELLAGLRENPLHGTARGLGRYGLWAKTGTVPAVDGRPLHTSGLVVAVDDAGNALLGILPDGTGREAARLLATVMASGRPAPALPRVEAETAPGGGRVSVALFDTLRPRVIVARNLGEHPIRTSQGYLGAGASRSLRPGDQLSEGRFRLSFPDRRFHREVVAALACSLGPAGTLRLRAEMTAPEYVAGVVNAELPSGSGGLRVALGAAVLRFLSDGPRHGVTQACDSTHCAWFIGRGPSVSWRTPTEPVLFARPASEGDAPLPLDAATWEAIKRAARDAGPRQWTSDCGGHPLSAHAVWGNGDRRVWACARHSGGSGTWARHWSDREVARAFGSPVRSAAVIEADGVWKLALDTARGHEQLGYDEAHRHLAEVLGWAALPSPATSVAREAGGFRAEGTGLGHRVGLCLGETALASASADDASRWR